MTSSRANARVKRRKTQTNYRAAEEGSSLAPPTSNAIDWKFRRMSDGMTVIIHERTWYDARQEACIRLGGVSKDAIQAVWLRGNPYVPMQVRKTIGGKR